MVWAHNSHLGDARFTGMGREGEHNVGQLVRQRHGDEAFLVGFTTHRGTVTAASAWGADAEFKQVRDALPDSYETLLHDLELDAFGLPTRDPRVAETVGGPRLERAIGVIYRPQTERASHYFTARLSRQFDWVIHVDETRAVEPLEPGEAWRAGVPDTYPWGV